MGKWQRNKGANFERRRAKWWQNMGYPKARRLLSQYQETDGWDIENIEPWVEQCKSGKAINILQALKEAKSACKNPNQIPLAAIKYDREEVLIVLSEQDFKKLLVNKKEL